MLAQYMASILIQTYLLAAGGITGEVCLLVPTSLLLLKFDQVYVWDMKDPDKLCAPTPGSRSAKTLASTILLLMISSKPLSLVLLKPSLLQKI